jgi:ribosomal protein L32
MMQCPHCQQDHPEGASFCPVSGKPIRSTSTCPNCGEKIEPTWAICAYCGKPTGKRASTPLPNVQSSYPSVIPPHLSKPVIYGGIGLVVFVMLILVFSALGGDKKPPRYGAFLKQGRSLVELPEIEMFGIPRESEIDQPVTTKDTNPVVLLWRPDTRLDYLMLFSLKGRSEVRYEAAAKGDRMIELTPTQSLRPGLYCYIQGDPLGTFLPGWCFEVK